MYTVTEVRLHGCPAWEAASTGAKEGSPQQGNMHSELMYVRTHVKDSHKLRPMPEHVQRQCLTRYH